MQLVCPATTPGSSGDLAVCVRASLLIHPHRHILISITHALGHGLKPRPQLGIPEASLDQGAPLFSFSPNFLVLRHPPKQSDGEKSHKVLDEQSFRQQYGSEFRQEKPRAENQNVKFSLIKHLLPPQNFVSNMLKQRRGALLASERPNSCFLYLKSISDLKSLLV